MNENPKEKKLEFFYTKKSLADSFEKTFANVTKSDSCPKSYTLQGNTPVGIINNDGISSVGAFNIFYSIRNINGKDQSSIIFNFISEDYGNLSFTMVLPDIFYNPSKKYETYATYRDGIFISSKFPRISAEVLNDKLETRKYTIYY